MERESSWRLYCNLAAHGESERERESQAPCYLEREKLASNSERDINLMLGSIEEETATYAIHGVLEVPANALLCRAPTRTWRAEREARLLQTVVELRERRYLMLWSIKEKTAAMQSLAARRRA